MTPRLLVNDLCRAFGLLTICLVFGLLPANVVAQAVYDPSEVTRSAIDTLTLAQSEYPQYESELGEIVQYLERSITSSKGNDLFLDKCHVPRPPTGRRFFRNGMRAFRAVSALIRYDLGGDAVDGPRPDSAGLDSIPPALRALLIGVRRNLFDGYLYIAEVALQEARSGPGHPDLGTVEARFADALEAIRLNRLTRAVNILLEVWEAAHDGIPVLGFDRIISLVAPSDSSIVCSEPIPAFVETPNQDAVSVVVNGTPASLTPFDQYMAADLPLRRGINAVVAVAVDAKGNYSSACAAVYLAECTAGNFAVTSSTLCDSDDAYPTSRMVRIDALLPKDGDFVAANARIQSLSTGYDSGHRALVAKDQSFFGHWDTQGLSAAPDYVIEVTLTDAVGGSMNEDLTVELQTNPPSIRKLVSDVDILVPALGASVAVVRSYLLDACGDGPLGFGWTLSYFMRVVATEDGVARVRNADGSWSFFVAGPDGSYRPPLGDHRTLEWVGDGEFTLRTKHGLVHRFSQNGFLASIEDRNGNMTTLSYDGAGRLDELVDASGRSTHLTWNSDDRVSMITDPAGLSVSYAYDTNSDLASVTDVGGGVTTYQYDASHNLIEITDAASSSIFFAVNGRDLLASMARADSTNGAWFAYDTPLPNVMTVTDTRGNAVEVTHDDLGFVTRRVDQLGDTVTQTQDGSLHLASVTDGAGRTSSYTYDSTGNVTSMTDALGNETFLAYEPTYNVITGFVDPAGRTVALEYDANGNLEKVTHPDGSFETYTYDAAGRLTSKTDRMSQLIEYGHDSRGLLTLKRYPDGSTVSFTYDPAGRLISVVDANGTISLTRNQYGDVTTVTYPSSHAVSYTYDPARGRTGIIYPDGTVVGQTYDGARRVGVIDVGGSPVATYTFDGFSAVEKRDLGNGVATDFIYDDAHRLVDIISSQASGTVLSSVSYTYDGIGNRTSRSDASGTTTYEYDALDRLIGVMTPMDGDSMFEYDAAGNRTSATMNAEVVAYSVNVLNQYTTIDSDGYDYDLNGNLIRIVAGADSTFFEYDFDNRLSAVVAPGGTIRYEYDPAGRRVRRESASDTTVYVHDDHRVIMEYDELGSALAKYVHGVRTDEVVLMNRSGVDYYYLYDGLGSVVGLTDAAGTQVESYSYGPFGTPDAASAVGNPYLFAGREWDPAVGLYYLRSRYYSSELGRFLTPDPIQFLGGLNLYEYVGNNPTNWVDPFGLYRDCERIPTVLVRSRAVVRHVSTELEKAGLYFGAAANATLKPRLIWREFASGGTATLELNAVIRELVEHTRHTSPDDFADYAPRVRQDDPREPGPGTAISNGDPTFIHMPVAAKMEDPQTGVSRDGLFARVSLPHNGSLVRGLIPVSGAALGRDFTSYCLDWGRGESPEQWETLATSDEPARDDLGPVILRHSQADASPPGNLAQWDTGLANYSYWPTYSGSGEGDLAGVHTLRLTVDGASGQSVEDRVTVTVGRVVSNVFGGSAASDDGTLELTVPEYAMNEGFALLHVAEENVDRASELLEQFPAGYAITGPVYRIDASLVDFLRPVTVSMSFDRDEAEDRRIVILGYDDACDCWIELDATATAQRGKALETGVLRLHSHYARASRANDAVPPNVDAGETDPSSVAAAPVGPECFVWCDFEESADGWTTDPYPAGGILETVTTADGGSCLEVSPADPSGFLSVRACHTAYDVRDYPIIQFDARATPGLAVNLRARVGLRWYEVQLTGEANSPAQKHVNLSRIGEVPDFDTDDEWSTIRIDLRQMLVAKTGNTTIDEIRLDNWNVAGYASIVPGYSAPTARLFIDNFAIRRAYRSNHVPDGQTLVVDGFDRPRSSNGLGGTLEFFHEASTNVGAVGHVTVDHTREAGGSLVFARESAAPGGFFGMISHLPPMDLRDYGALSMSVYHLDQAEHVYVGVEDSRGVTSNVRVSPYVADTLESGWSRVQIPLSAFDMVQSWNGVRKVTVSASSEWAARAFVLDELAFTRELQRILVDDFDPNRTGNRLGLGHEISTYGAAELTADPSRGGVLFLTSSGTTGMGRGWAAWTTDLGGIRCRGDHVLTFRIRGAVHPDGLPDVHVATEDHNWGFDLRGGWTAEDEWQWVSVPLSYFETHGVDLTRIDNVSFVFGREGSVGSVQIDDVAILEPLAQLAASVRVR